MAISAFGLLLTIIAFLYPSSAFCLSASHRGPRALLSTVKEFPPFTPPQMNDVPNFSSILSKQSFPSEVLFCSLAEKACSSELNSLKPFAAVYETIDESTPITPPPFSMQSLSFSFFRQSALKPGNKIHLSKSQEEFPQHALLRTRPVKINQDEELQNLVSQSFITSATKEAIKSNLLKYCNSSEQKGSKINSCPKSLGEMIKFSKLALAAPNHLVALTTKSTKISSKQLQIGNVKKMNVDEIVSCHGVLLDSATYFCQAISRVQVYVVDVIEAKTKAPINTVLATCHMDTSEWPKNHVAFKILKSSPGKVEACHWSTDLDLVWFGYN